MTCRQPPAFTTALPLCLQQETHHLGSLSKSGPRSARSICFRICRMKKKSCSMILQDHPRDTLGKVLVHQVRNAGDRAQAYSVWNQVAHSAIEAGDILVPKPGENYDLKEDERDHDMGTVTVIATMLAGKTVGAGRLVRRGCNVLLERVAVLPEMRGRSIGRSIVERLMKLVSSVDGAIWVKARRSEMGFWSILGFETQGGEKWEEGGPYKTMVYRWPICNLVHGRGCVGLHHIVVQVADIERSLAFYGGVGFIVTEKFYASGGRRSCFVEGLGTRLKLMEKEATTKSQKDQVPAPAKAVGRIMIDVTKACKDLTSFLEHLKNRNGGILKVVEKPAMEISASTMLAVAAVQDPDGLEIGFFRRESQLSSELRTEVKW